MLVIIEMNLAASISDEIPVLYKGRFRPFEAYSQLWLYDLYHKESIYKSHLKEFGLSDGDAEMLLWNLHISGHNEFDEAPLFWITNQRLKSYLELDLKKDRFSFNSLKPALVNGNQAFVHLMKLILPYLYFKNYNDASNKGRSSKLEINQLRPGLWMSLQENHLVIAATSQEAPWNQLIPGTIIAANILNHDNHQFKSQKKLAEDTLQLLNAIHVYDQMNGIISPFEENYANMVQNLIDQRLKPQEIATALDTQFSLQQRLQNSGQDLKLLPSKIKDGSWYSIRALSLQVYDPEERQLVSIPNFTKFSDKIFTTLKLQYFELSKAMKEKNISDISSKIANLSNTLMQGFLELAGKPYVTAFGKALHYPTHGQLKAERIYYHYPLIGTCIALYAFAVSLLILGTLQHKNLIYKTGMAFLWAAFLWHTAILLLRCYILSRPPVSNMYETVIYVPWIAVLLSLILKYYIKNTWVLIASSFLALVLLVLMKIANMSSSLENVQAVLDSQYWLIIHVLMVVGSYGFFALCGILGHFYLINYLCKKRETENMQSLGRLVLHTIYLGTALLIPGTILGGVWAAESWGRFWDWDPKESWAFISSCVYLMWIHAYRFNHIGNFGLAIGSIIGFQMISFTWYGVNYILGTGLHSYGFGSGGEIFYYFFILFEMTFVIGALILSKRIQGMRREDGEVFAKKTMIK
jgi:ABC-type transport system involved in cytochrome c biogenesis permease subunit